MIERLMGTWWPMSEETFLLALAGVAFTVGAALGWYTRRLVYGHGEVRADLL